MDNRELKEAELITHLNTELDSNISDKLDIESKESNNTIRTSE